MPVDGNPAVPELVLPRLFERAAALRPHRTALSGDGPEVSYADLNARANRLARTLRLTQVRDGAPAGLYLDRSADLVVALLAVLKAGGCVVPLNPAYPAKMIRHIVEETGLRTVVHQGQPSLAEADLPVRQAHVADLMEESASQDDHDLDQAPAAGDDALVLFTSGSTGRPKGVRLAHRGLARLAVADPKLTITPDDCLVQLAAFSFAASGNEFWLSLLNGAELVLLPPGLPSLSDLRDVITKHGVSVLSLPCGLFNLLVDNELDALRQLRVIMVSGDFPSPAHLATAAEHTTAAIFNGYGCTENSAISSLYPITFGGPRAGPRPGRQAADRRHDGRARPGPQAVPARRRRRAVHRRHRRRQRLPEPAGGPGREVRRRRHPLPHRRPRPADPRR